MRQAEKVVEHPAVWFQASACSGCVVAVLNGAAPTIRDLIVDQLAPGRHVSLRFQQTIMAGAGEVALELLAAAEEGGEGYLLVVDGALPTAAGGRFGLAAKQGAHTTMHARGLELAAKASAIIALGTCASYGGIHAAAPNPSGCVSISEALREAGIEKPVINVPGCPPHPDWFTGTVAAVLLGGTGGGQEASSCPTDRLELDVVGRPRRFFGRLLHDLCPRRGDFEAHKFAARVGDPGCLYELGCKGPWTHADCPEREFNHGVNWCVKAGSPCHGCVEPFFPDVSCPIYEKIGLAELPRLVRDEAGGLVAVARPRVGDR